jgi:predicted MFS family arabinose efflux permease
VLLPYLLINDARYSPVQAGLSLLPFSIVIGVASRLTGRWTGRIGPRWPLTIAPVITAVGFLLMVRLNPNENYWTNVLPGIFVVAVGMAGAVAPLTTAVLASLDDSHTGTASGFNSAVARTGGLIATALAGGVIAETGRGLLAGFHIAVAIAAAVGTLSGAAAFFMLPKR